MALAAETDPDVIVMDLAMPSACAAASPSSSVGPGPATRMLDLFTRRPAAGRFPVSAREQEVLEQLTAGRSNQVANRREAMLRHHDR